MNILSAKGNKIYSCLLINNPKNTHFLLSVELLWIAVHNNMYCELQMKKSYNCRTSVASCFTYDICIFNWMNKIWLQGSINVKQTFWQNKWNVSRPNAINQKQFKLSFQIFKFISPLKLLNWPDILKNVN